MLHKPNNIDYAKNFIEKAKVKHNNKYDYSKVDYKFSSSKVIITCPEHGDFEQTPNSHLIGHGCGNCSKNYNYSTAQFIEKAKAIHGNKYGYSKTSYINARTKVIVTCSKHGDFFQVPNNHLNNQGCPKCKIDKSAIELKSNTEEFIQKAKIIHVDIYNYKKVNYINNYTKVTITCNQHGDFEQAPNVHLKGVGCPTCKASKGELTIKAILDKHNIVYIPQWKFPNEKFRFEYDFYLPEFNLLIEFHGKQHYEYSSFFHKTYNDFEEQLKRDSWKMTLAKTKGISLLEFNYKQLKHMTKEQFEALVLQTLSHFVTKN